MPDHPPTEPPSAPALPARSRRPSVLEMALVAGEAALYSVVDALAHAFAISDRLDVRADVAQTDPLASSDSLWPSTPEFFTRSDRLRTPPIGLTG